jgi:cation-transporting ATPase E
VLGAPEMVFPQPDGDSQRSARARADELAGAGYRVVALARSDDTAAFAGDTEARLPLRLVPAALVILAEQIRDDAQDTLRFFTEQGVALKVISGDNPRTVGAVAMRVGVPGIADVADVVDARTLPEDLDDLAAVVEHHNAFGRVTPHQKRAMVAALQSRGHVVAMTGDGVNDALALKDADIGVAMGNGSPATRAVAQLVLLDGKFAHLPSVVAEGRRVIANIERAANLFLVKNVYSLVLAVIAAATLAAYPLAPIQLTLISTLTIGVPGFALALGPNQRRYLPGFLGRVLHFAIPTGLIVAAAAYVGYRMTRLIEPHATVAEGRTAAALVILIVSLWTLTVLARPMRGWKLAVVVGVAAIAVLAVAVPPLANGVFLLNLTPLRALIAAVVGVAGAALVELSARVLRS